MASFAIWGWSNWNMIKKINSSKRQPLPSKGKGLLGDHFGNWLHRFTIQLRYTMSLFIELYNLRGYKNLMLMVESCIVYMCLRDLKKKRKHSIRIWHKHTIWLSPIITWHVSVSQTIKSTCHTLSLHKTQFHKIKIKNHPSTAEPPTLHTVVGKASGALLDSTKLPEPRFLWSN